MGGGYNASNSSLIPLSPSSTEDFTVEIELQGQNERASCLAGPCGRGRREASLATVLPARCFVPGLRSSAGWGVGEVAVFCGVASVGVASEPPGESEAAFLQQGAQRLSLSGIIKCALIIQSAIDHPRTAYCSNGKG